MMKDLDLARQLIVKGSYEEFHLWYDDLSQPLSELIRTSFVPSEGNTFAVADFSAIEARVIAWLAGEEWVLEVFRTHGKIYEATAAKMFSVKLEDVTKDLRGKGKVSTLALGFQGSVEALERMGGYAIYAPLFLSRLERLKNGEALVSDFPESLMCEYPQVTKLLRTDNKMSESILREWTKYEVLGPLVFAWRKENPHIVQLWYDCQRAAIQAVESGTVVVLKQKGIKFIGAKNMLFVELPSGRRLSYVRPRLVEGEYGKKLQYWGVNQETKKWGLVDTYGGKLTENIVQAIARDCLAESMLALDAENYKICIHIHDEVVIETPVEKAEKELENICRIMGREISWAKGLPLSAAGYLTPYYKKD
jgi:DNA polymerase